MVFTDIDLGGDFIATDADRQIFQPAVSKPKIQALQAAYNICLFQNWEGSDLSKRRIRRNRFSILISVSPS